MIALFVYPRALKMDISFDWSRILALIADTREKKARNMTIAMMIENIISRTKLTISIDSDISA